jgi:glycosyltransferase involved in cell wall biosynthesis
VHLLMVGDGPDERVLREMAEALGLEDHISFFAFTDEPNYVFEMLDLTVLPSLEKEGLPNVLLESMSMGVPVVSSRIGGIAEIVIPGETGSMVDPGEPGELAEAIHALWADQDRYQRMKIKARELIASQFDKAAQYDRFLAHFRALVEDD